MAISPPKGTWNSLTKHDAHWVEPGATSSLCEKLTLNFITDDKWKPASAEAHCCGQCVEKGAVLPAGGCPCPICQNPHKVK